jgi:hypothetical protein
MPGARSQPAASRAKKTTHEFSHHRYAASTGIPCAMVLRFPSCSSRGPGFLAPVAREFVHELGASVGAPEPHDFAVRDSTARLAAPSASIASRSTFRDDRDTPLLAVRDGTALLLFLPIEKAKNFLKTGWTGPQISAANRRAVSRRRNPPPHDEKRIPGSMLVHRPGMTSDKFYPGFAFNPAASMPAMAQISSLSDVSPETPTAPSSVPPSWIRTPPGTGTRRPCASEFTASTK